MSTSEEIHDWIDATFNPGEDHIHPAEIVSLEVFPVQAGQVMSLPMPPEILEVAYATLTLGCRKDGDETREDGSELGVVRIIDHSGVLLSISTREDWDRHQVELQKRIDAGHVVEDRMEHAPGPWKKFIRWDDLLHDMVMGVQDALDEEVTTLLGPIDWDLLPNLLGKDD